MRPEKLVRFATVVVLFLVVMMILNMLTQQAKLLSEPDNRSESESRPAEDPRYAGQHLEHIEQAFEQQEQLNRDQAPFLAGAGIDQAPLNHQLVGKDSQSAALKWYHSDNVAFSARDTTFGRDLQPALSVIPKVVHMVWCGQPYNDTYFEFKHFLSVKSAIHFLNPDAIYLYYAQPPAVDVRMYNTWLDELLDTFPFIFIREASLVDVCVKDAKSNYVARWKPAARPLNETGGIYMKLDIILTAPLPGIVEGHLTQIKLPSGELVLVSGVQGSFRHDPRTMTSLYHPKYQHVITCVEQEEFNWNPQASCVRIKNGTTIYPKDYFNTDDPFSRIIRTLFYGEPKGLVIKPNAEEVIPRIGHYFWFGGGKMEYIFYLSVLSCLHVLKLQGVYVHGDKPPAGEFWAELHKDKRVHWIHRYRSKKIYQTKLFHIAHEADVAGLDAILKYGGVHCDPDMVFIKEFDPEFWKYDAIAAPSQTDNWPFPNIINWGLFLGKPHAQFWWMVQRSERDFIPRHWNWNSARLVYKIYERNPSLLKLDPHLQVMCWGGVCIPRWLETRNQGKLWNRNVTSWMDTIYCFHYTEPTPIQLLSEDAIRTGKGPHAKVGRIVLEASGIW